MTIKEWLKDLFHFHKWEVVSRGNIIEKDYSERNEVKVGDYFYLKCTHCGKLKLEKYVM